MSDFIKAKGQSEIVNLSKVTYINFLPDTKDSFKNNESCHMIRFYFNSMSEEDVLYAEWSFQDKNDYDKVVSFLEGHIVEEL